MRDSKILVVFFALLLVGFMTSAAMAKTGGVKVDTDSDCTNGTQSSNTVFGCGIAYVQINFSGKNVDSEISCQLCNNGTAPDAKHGCFVTTCTFVHQCSNGGANYYTYSFPVFGTGTTTLVVNNAEGNVGADTFKANCTD